FTSETPHDAIFISSGLNYGEGGGNLGSGNNLTNWIGDDADTLDYPVQQDAGDAIIRFSGGFYVDESGTFDFEIRHDDGFIVFIDGIATFTADFITPPSNYSSSVDLTAGMHTVQIYYWDQGGQYVFDGGLYDRDRK